MKEFEQPLDEAAQYHGHLCAGQVLGVRIGMAGVKWLEIDNPYGNKSLIVYVETDRCATDAIQTVTGCKLGRRSLKYLDYGKMAATFVDIHRNVAIRVSVPGRVRELAKKYCPELENPYLEAYKIIPDEELLVFEEVVVDFKPEDLPGKPLRRVTCDGCGEEVNDGREIVVGLKTLCKACNSTPYYRKI